MGRRFLPLLSLIAGLALLPACSDGADGAGWDNLSTGRDTSSAADTGSADTGSVDTAPAPETGDPDPVDTFVRPDTNDTGTPDSQDVDATDVPDAGDTDAVADTDASCVDSDSDGLTDCEEGQLCTDPEDGDTDGDYLSDFEELKHQTDPCTVDTDGDGVEDKEELELGLDPTDPSTFAGKNDGNLWRVDACKNPASEPVDFHSSANGGWKLALPPPYQNYTNLQITNPPKLAAAATYSDQALKMAGAIMSRQRGSGNTTLPLQGDVHRTLESVGTFAQGETGGEFRAGGGRAATGRYLVKTDQKMSVGQLRQDLLLDLAPFDKSDVSGLPSTSGDSFRKFRVSVSVIFRKRSGGSYQTLFLLGIVPNSVFEKKSRVRFDLRDITNPTIVTDATYTHLTRCWGSEAQKEAPAAEFYWVLDQSGSMVDDHQKLADYADSLVEALDETGLDYRLGVTNMDKDNDGHLRTPPAWHTAARAFRAEVKQAVINCTPGGGWKCGGSREYGLEAAKRGIEYMTGSASTQPAAAEQIRNGAEIFPVFISDEEANTVKNRDNTKTYAAAVRPYKTFFERHATGYAIVGDGGECGAEKGRAYRDVAATSGGTWGSVCAEKLTERFERIVTSASGRASTYKLPDPPISSSLRVYVDDQWVPRGREDGYMYFPASNTIAFFGKHRPTPTSQNQSGPTDYIAVHYEQFKP